MMQARKRASLVFLSGNGTVNALVIEWTLIDNIMVIGRNMVKETKFIAGPSWKNCLKKVMSSKIMITW